MVDYRKHMQSKQTEQDRPDQVLNSAGGYVWEVDQWEKLDRFLILGTEGGSYYANERELTRQNVQSMTQCLYEDGLRVVDRIVEVSQKGLAVKLHPTIFALAVALEEGDDETRRAAARALPKVCRTGRHLLTAAKYLMGKPGVGRNVKQAFANWYNGMDASRLAYQMVKYQQDRDGYSQADVLRTCRPDPFKVKRLRENVEQYPNDWRTAQSLKEMEAAGIDPDPEQHDAIYNYVINGWDTIGREPHPDEDLQMLWAFERAKVANEKETFRLINEFGLPREAVMTKHLNSRKIWEALLDNQGRGMPMWALVRNLPKMTQVGLIQRLGGETKRVVEMLTNKEALRRSRMHPMKILQALVTYQSGQGYSSSWSPVSQVVNALDAAFYECFENVEPTHKRTLMGLDVSGSMGAEAGGMGFDCRTASAAMALITASKEFDCMAVAFAANGSGGFWNRGTRLEDFDVSPRQRLDDVVLKMNRLDFGATDCSLPILHAMENNLSVDHFIIYTDSETYAGNVHPATALRRYRQKSGIKAKLSVVGMTSNGFSIADPEDAGMMDFVGLSSSTPQAISTFARG